MAHIFHRSLLGVMLIGGKHELTVRFSMIVKVIHLYWMIKANRALKETG